MDHLTCKICLEPFDEGSRAPLILPACGHTLCEECASKSIQFSRISCPFDRKEAPVIDGDVKNLNKNFTVLEAIREQNIHCEENEHHIAVVYCTTCKVNYCDACSKTTHSSKTMSTHKMVKVSEKPETPLYCPQHEHQVAELFCEDVSCKVECKVTCAKCHLDGVHKGHNYKTLDKIYEEKMKKISNKLEETRGLIKETKSEIGKVGNQPDSIETDPEYINEKNELERKYQKDLDLLKQRMNRKMNKKREELHKFLNTKLDELCILEKTFLTIKSQRKADFFRKLANAGNNIKKNEQRKTVRFEENINPTKKSIIEIERENEKKNEKLKREVHKKVENRNIELGTSTSKLKELEELLKTKQEKLPEIVRNKEDETLKDSAEIRKEPTFFLSRLHFSYSSIRGRPRDPFCRDATTSPSSGVNDSNIKTIENEPPKIVPHARNSRTTPENTSTVETLVPNIPTDSQNTVEIASPVVENPVSISTQNPQDDTTPKNLTANDEGTDTSETNDDEDNEVNST